MTFTEAVKSCIGKYATFKGRAPRSEFWWFTVMVSVGSGLCSGVFSFIGGMIDDKPLLPGGISLSMGNIIGYGIASLISIVLFYIPWWAVTVRRLHDTGHSGKLLVAYLLTQLLIVVNSLILFVNLIGVVVKAVDNPYAASGSLASSMTMHGIVFAVLGLAALVLGIWLLVLMCIDSTDGENKYGLPVY